MRGMSIPLSSLANFPRSSKQPKTNKPWDEVLKQDDKPKEETDHSSVRLKRKPEIHEAPVPKKLKETITINSDQELWEHKKSFDEKYKEYETIREKIITIQQQFKELGERLKSNPNTQTELFNEINSLYHKQYHETQSLKEKHNTLHNELKQIKLAADKYLYPSGK